jgi:hypothetical protein
VINDLEQNILKRIEELEIKVNKLEHVVYRKDVEKCPRCGQNTMNFFQKDVCYLCAYIKGDSL